MKPNETVRLLFSILFFVLIVPIINGAEKSVPSANDSPYGICSHLSIVQLEHQQIPQNLQVMREAGIRWIRTDFSWRILQKKDGSWNFAMTDHLLDEAEKYGMKILPILEHPAPNMIPTIRHLDQWCEYVQQTVTHYKDRLEYWEVWNEHNVSKELGDEPKPEYYVELLKRTFETIKEIDPRLKVVYGGLAGVPHQYFEKTLEFGAGRYFDVMNIHPYRSGLQSVEETQKFRDDIRKFKDLMNKYILPSRPIWITEMGWPTPRLYAPCEMQIADAAFSLLFPDGIKGRIAFFYDSQYDDCARFADGSADGLIPPGCPSEAVDQKKLADLDPNQYPVLFLPPSQTCPEPFYDAIYRYVKKGGTIFLTGGIPFYYGTKTEDGHVSSDTSRFCGTKYCKPLGISWYAWWTQKNVPKEAPVFFTEKSESKPRYINDKVIQAAKKKLPNLKGMRFLDDNALREGDRMIPLMKARSNGFEGVIAALYQLNNKDIKGNIIVCSLLTVFGNSTNVRNQAVWFPQSILTALNAETEKYFWYEFISEERDPGYSEDHFGIVHADLSPKPVYYAWKTLTSVRPEGSAAIQHELKENLSIVSWRRPDGKIAWALWAPLKKTSRKCVINGKVEKACDYLGNPVPLNEKNKSIDLSDEIIYLIGPDEITFL